MKTWLITGTSSGLGRIMTEAVLARGDSVTATVRKPEALARLKGRYGERLRVAVVDLTDTQAIRREVDAAFAAHGTIDVVVSNAGYGLFGAIEEVTDAQIERQIATNLLASIQLIRAALPHLRHQGAGRIVQTSSEGGQTTYPGFGLYHVTKWGIEAFVETLAKEVAPFGIQCMLAEPGPTGTNFAASVDFGTPLEPYSGTPADTVRNAIVDGTFKLTGDANRTVAAMIAAIDAEHMPLRLTLGSVAYDNIEAALLARLDLIRSQKALAYGADVEG